MDGELSLVDLGDSHVVVSEPGELQCVLVVVEQLLRRSAVCAELFPHDHVYTGLARHCKRSYVWNDSLISSPFKP